MKYTETLVSFSEIPDEITLCINISNCPYHCPGCHSPWLWEDKGTELNVDELHRLVEKNEGITCVCFMGGTEREIKQLIEASNMGLKHKIGWYTGSDKIPDLEFTALLDYLKIGPYIEELGPLTSRTTNQQFYRIGHTAYPASVSLENITSRFWKEK